MTTRQEFLARVASRLVDGIPDNPIRPHTPSDNDPIEYTVDSSDLVARFVEAATTAGAEVVEATSADLPLLAAEILQGLGGDAPRVAVSGEPQSQSLAADLERSGITIERSHDPADLSGVALGITGARAGVALTGSIVIDSSIPGARVVSLLPDVHLAVLAASDIAPNPGAVLRSLQADNLPSNLVFATGPSRSADIELQLTVGVHGPERLVVAVVR